MDSKFQNLQYTLGHAKPCKSGKSSIHFNEETFIYVTSLSTQCLGRTPFSILYVYCIPYVHFSKLPFCFFRCPCVWLPFAQFWGAQLLNSSQTRAWHGNFHPTNLQMVPFSTGFWHGQSRHFNSGLYQGSPQGEALERARQRETFFFSGEAVNGFWCWTTSKCWQRLGIDLVWRSCFKALGFFSWLTHQTAA